MTDPEDKMGPIHVSRSDRRMIALALLIAASISLGLLLWALYV